MSRPLSTSIAALVALGTIVVACASADPDAVRGGGIRDGFDAAPPPALDAGVVEKRDESAPPTSWRGLYRDFFGRNALSSCAGTGNCHGSEGEAGVSAGSFVCGNVDQCYASFRSQLPDGKLNSGFVNDTDVASPDGARIFKVLRIRNADGTVQRNQNMPQTPADFAFTQADLERMKTWIRNGAKKD